MSTFPPLPERDLGPWPPDIQAGYAIVERIYNHASQVLRSDGFPEPTRIAFHVDALESTALPILKALVPDVSAPEEECLPQEWVVGAAQQVEMAVQDLQDMVEAVTAMSVPFLLVRRY